MTREDYQSKGRRYVVEDRLVVQRVDERETAPTCRGGGAVYRVGWRDGVWHCDCPARSRCTHIYALQLVTVRTPESRS